jgi:tetratricopeptide (TPR) repeat protein
MNRRERRAQKAAAGRPDGADVFARAVDHHRAGRLAEAQRLYNLVLAADPQHADSLNLLGVIAAQTGRHDLAIQRIEAAIARNGRVAGYHNNLGEVLRQCGRLADAAARFRMAIALAPEDADAHNNLGATSHALGDVSGAADHYRRALMLRPAYSDALANLAAACQEQGDASQAARYQRRLQALDPSQARHMRETAPRNPAGTDGAASRRLAQTLVEQRRPDEALVVLRQAALRDDGDPSLFFDLGRLAQERGYPAEAERAYRAVLALRPDHAVAWNNLGNALRDLGRRDEAVAALRTAWGLDPFYAEAYFNLGVLLHHEAALSAAAPAYRHALATRPDFAEAATNLGAALLDLGQGDDALVWQQRALAIAPDSPRAHVNHGVVLYGMGRTGDAIAAFREALRRAPDHAQAHVNLAHALLMAGRFGEGWREYEWRWRGGIPDLHPRPFDRPRWRGEPLAGRTLLLHAEQGLGDTLQFIRYAPLLAARGARVIVEAPQSLCRLLTTVPGVTSVVATGQPLPPFDWHLPLMSAPGACDTTPERIPAGGPYLSADPALRAAWHERLAQSLPPVPRVGLVWAGAPRQHDPRLSAADSRRSIPPALLGPLLATSGVAFVSLQKGRAAADLAGRDLPIFDATDQLSDFADTAALVDALDLVISVDTSVAHLAGALGKPVWILSRFDGCWRWQTGRSDSPWYPTARLYRQTAPGDWPGVIARVAADLFPWSADRR